MYSVIIDGEEALVPEDATILQAARMVGARIPTLCYLKERSAIASCRVCVVEVEGEPHPVPACSTLVRDGMEVTTRSPRLAAYRKAALELILSSKGRALANLARAKGDDASELSSLCQALGVEADGRDGYVEAPVLDANPFLSYDPNICIECQRCVGACNSAARNHSLHTASRGARRVIEAPFGPDWRATDCESCGNCAQACPTGAISLVCRPAKSLDAATASGAGPCPSAAAGRTEVQPSLASGQSLAPEAVSLTCAQPAAAQPPAPGDPAAARFVRTTCPHCGVGCQLELEVRGNRIVGARGAQGASNRGLLCVKGRSASYDFVSSPDRLTTPLVRNPETGQLEPATWDEALDVVASRFTALRRTYGGTSLAAFACSRSTNEDVYLFQKMARVALKTNNVDSCARV